MSAKSRKINRRGVLFGGAASVCAPYVLRADTLALELCFLLDCSGSMYSVFNASEVASVPYHGHIIQRDGHVQALNNPEVAAMLLWAQPLLRAFIWSDVVSEIASVHAQARDDIVQFAEAIKVSVPRARLGYGSTDHRAVLSHFVSTEQRLGRWRVLDLSTNEAPASIVVDDCVRFVSQLEDMDTTVNALMVDRPIGASKTLLPLITHDGFIQPVSGGDDYEDSLAMKIVAEVS